MRLRKNGSTHKVRIKVANPGDSETTLVLEPWGETYPMPPGSVFDIVGDGPVSDTLELSFEDRSVTVWGWAGSVLRLFRGGAELGDAHCRPPVPVAQANSEQPLQAPGR